jgi:para-aminobenzoate synthetase/4-amino-4-deoxychorismate lyase
VRAVLHFEPFGRVAFDRPLRVLRADEPSGVRPLLRAVEAEAAEGRWAVGFLAYEAAPAFDRALRVRPPVRGPLACFAIYFAPSDPPRTAGQAHLSSLEPEISPGDHAAAVSLVRDALARGDAYQVNLTFRLAARFEGDPFALHDRLRAAQGGGWTACLDLGDRAIVSASPELFFHRAGPRVEVRPMKGTARRGRWLEEDEAAAAGLTASAKDRAENVMIVDLLRNDLGKVAEPGSVEVGRLFEVERWRTVLQMTSTVAARVPPSVGLEALLAALFPSGSVTGAPKVAATAFIAALERSPRGPYCGAVGLVAPGGEAVFNVAIRTLDLDLRTGAATCATGGGVTWGSSASGEWDEALAKTAFLADPAADFQLLETVRAEGGSCPRLERHLARAAASARYFGFAADPERARAALEAAAEPGAAQRLRLLTSPDGSVRVESAPLPGSAPLPWPVALSRRPVARDDRFLFHKTTRREVYDVRRAERPDAADVLLQNGQGEITEFTIGNLVAEIGGERLTPARDCGLLAGVFREELLARGGVREAVLREADLARARRLWLVNALRGEVPVRLVR